MTIMKNHFNREIQNTFEVDMTKKSFEFDQRKCLQWIIGQGVDIYGQDFVLTEPLIRTYKVLLCYAVEDLKSMAAYDLQPHKGILLMGPPLSGKTAVMHLTKSFYKKKKNYKIYNIKKLTCDFAQKGHAALDEIMSLKYPICLDGIGEEKQMRHFGNVCDIVPEIVEYYYQNRPHFSFPMLHITTRLSSSQLEKRYGTEFRLMLKELMNVIVIK